MDQIIAFFVTAFALVGSPGPNTLSLAAIAAAFGARRALGYKLGLLLGMVLVVILTGAGVTGLILAQPLLAPVIVWLAAGYFIYLAYRIATAPPISEQSPDRKPPGPLAGTTMSLSNPKAYAAVGATLSGYVLVAGAPVADMLMKSAGLIMVVALVNLCWLLTGAALTKHLRDTKTNRVINIGFAVLLLVSVGLAVL